MENEILKLLKELKEDNETIKESIIKLDKKIENLKEDVIQTTIDNSILNKIENLEKITAKNLFDISTIKLKLNLHE